MNTNILNIGILLCCLAVSVSSCNNGTKKADSASDTATNTQDTLQAFVSENKQANIAFTKNVDILLPRRYRKDSTGYPKNVKDKEWYEIYKDPKTKKWTIAKAELKSSFVLDECIGEDAMLIKSEHENAVLFFTSFDGLSEIPETVLENKPLIPGMPVNFKMNDKNYSLSASATDDEGNVLSADKLPLDSEGNVYLYAKNYKLNFGSEEAKSYSIAEVEEMRDVNPKVVWAGDLNGDGLPDMILDLSDDYESYHLYFFLSDKNDPQKPLKKIGDGMVVFDC